MCVSPKMDLHCTTAYVAYRPTLTGNKEAIPILQSIDISTILLSSYPAYPLVNKSLIRFQESPCFSRISTFHGDSQLLSRHLHDGGGRSE